MNHLYVACVNFMLNAALLLGITYRDINALILLVGFPFVTLTCFIMCLVPYERFKSN